MMLRMTRSGRITPIEAMPTPDLAVPYAAPMSAAESPRVRKGERGYSRGWSEYILAVG